MKEIELAGLKFWITADDKKIDFDLKDVTSRENDILKNNHSVYFMERAVVLVPNLPDSFSYKKLSLESNKNWSKMEGDRMVMSGFITQFGIGKIKPGV